MNKSSIGVILVALSIAVSAFAAEKVITVGVKGMVCGFCAQGIEKKFSAEPAVDQVKVSLGEKRVTLKLKDKQDISDETIKRILGDSGYSVDKVER